MVSGPAPGLDGRTPHPDSQPPCGPGPRPESRPASRLFQVNVGPPKKLEELDPETREYWRLLRKLNIWRHNRLSKSRKF